MIVYLIMAKFRFLADGKVEIPSIFQAHLRIQDLKGGTNYVRLVCNSYYIATTLVCNISKLQVKSRLPILRCMEIRDKIEKEYMYLVMNADL